MSLFPSNESCHLSYSGKKGLNSNNGCSCNYCGESSGIVNVDQGYFHNIATKRVLDVPTVELAYITNCENDSEIDSTIYLNPTYLTWRDFSLLFFRQPGGGFYINGSNSFNAAISFSSQTYETTQNKKVSFTLYDQVIKAWSKKTNKPESNVSIPSRIHLERQAFLTKSLASITGYQIGLSLDEAFTNLLNNKQIEPSDEDNAATVKFNISYKYYFAPLNISLIVVFTFVTKIPCYKNICETDICPYSNDNRPCRKNFECDDSSIQEYQNENQTENNTETQTVFSAEVTEYLMEESVARGEAHSQIDKILNCDNSSTDNSSYSSWNK
jgi:ribosome-associated toxin RatA of RatAB toxin-antitoxin module